MLVLQTAPLQVQTVVHAIHMCHSLLLELAPTALETVADIMCDVLTLCLPRILPPLLEAANISEAWHGTEGVRSYAFIVPHTGISTDDEHCLGTTYGF
jgi:hypothetical protein